MGKQKNNYLFCFYFLDELHLGITATSVCYFEKVNLITMELMHIFFFVEGALNIA